MRGEMVSLDRMLPFFNLSEIIKHDFGTTVEESRSSIFLGTGERHGRHLFLDFESLVNPHLFIIGMSGSGKTYLMRSLLLKMCACTDNEIIVIDFTGEYLCINEFVSENAANRHGNGNTHSRIRYFGMERLEENRRREKVENVLSEIAAQMKASGLSNNRKVFVFLDEAWKAIGLSKSLTTILREGRKYGVGLIMASQLLGDIESGMLTNSSGIFVFRIQDEDSVRRLAADYGISTESICAMSDLGRGSCMVIKTLRGGGREIDILKRVVGVSLHKSIKVAARGGAVEIGEAIFLKMIREVSRKDPSALISELSSKKRIGIVALVESLIGLGAEKLRILSMLRRVGFSDSEIAEAFSFAIMEGFGDASG